MPYGFYHYCSLGQLGVRDGNSPEVLLFLRILFHIQGFSFFHMKLRIARFMPVKNCLGILMWLELDLNIAFGRMVISTVNLMSMGDLFVF